jgi:hypothetical protein
LILTALLFGAWFLSAALLPEGILREYFSRLFAGRVGEFTWEKILLANLLPFLAIQFMNLFRVSGRPGGIYVLPMFWILYGVSLGTNSFVFAGERVPFSLSILWERTGFTELLAYTLGYEAARDWALWQGAWRVSRLPDRTWRIQAQDVIYWCAGLLLLILSAVREVS